MQNARLPPRICTLAAREPRATVCPVHGISPKKNIFARESEPDVQHCQRRWEVSIQPGPDPARRREVVGLCGCAGAGGFSPSQPRRQHWGTVPCGTLLGTDWVRASRCTSPRRRVLVGTASWSVRTMRWYAISARSEQRCAMTFWLLTCAVLLQALDCLPTARPASAASLSPPLR
jgi:hypothetical protein